MADVQLEKGHLRIANALNRALIVARFTDLQRRVVHLLIDQTYGWQRKTVELSTSEMAAMLDVTVSGGFRAAVAELIEAGVIQLVRAGSGRTRSVFAVQKDHESWGKFSIAAAMLAARFGKRPLNADALLGVDASADDTGDDDDHQDHSPPLGPPIEPKQNDASDNVEGAPEKAPSLVSEDARTEAPSNGYAFGEAPWVPAQGEVVCLPTVTLTPPKSIIGETYEAGKTGEPVLTTTTTTTPRASARVEPGQEPPVVDTTSLLRWSELAAALVSDHNRGNVLAFLARLRAEERDAWSGRFANWLAGLDCPPSLRPTPDVLSTALSEYAGDRAPRHVWSFVEDAVRRFERANGDPTHLRIPGVSGRGARSPDPVSASIGMRALELFTLGKEFELFAYESESGYAARLQRAGADPRAGAQFTAEVTIARLWDGLHSIRQERIAVEEISRRLTAGGWKVAS